MKPRLALLALALGLAAPAHAANIQGTPVPDTVTVDGKELRYNGSGVRKKFVVKVYIGTLYLPRSMKTTEEVVALDEAKLVRLHFLRDVSKSQVMDAFREGFRNNSAAQADQLAPRLEQLAKAIPGELKEKSVLTFAWIPGKGTVVKSDAGEAVVEGKDFNDALMRNWLGPKPADGDVKKGMLHGG